MNTKRVNKKRGNGGRSREDMLEMAQKSKEARRKAWREHHILPSKYCYDIHDVLVKDFRMLGYSRQRISELLSISESTFDKWLKRHTSFRNAYGLGNAVCNTAVINALYNKCLSGDVNAIKFWLQNKERVLWGNKAEESNISFASIDLDSEL